ncbi:hypothetical protein HOE04_04425 [archaeon]|nr:hypothetical protein [archaeon]
MLNLPKEINERYGKNIDKMPRLLGAGEVPISVSGIMQARLEQGNEFPDLWNNWYDTSDLVVYTEGNNKELYVFLTVDNQGKITKNGRKALELIRQDNLASNHGAIVEQLKDLGRKGLIKVPRNKITTENYLTRDQVLDEQVWRILARDSNEVHEDFAEEDGLLGKYFDEVASRTKDPKNMALYVGDSLKDQTTLKAWCVDWLGYRSFAYGRNDLDDDNGRLLGIAPEAQNVPDKIEKVSQLEESVKDALSQKQAFEYQGTLYVPVQDKKVRLEEKK